MTDPEPPGQPGETGESETGAILTGCPETGK
eukprot:COSAG06_NODE_33535_length_488_cov_0.799486_1_plen_30_part_10